SALVSDGPLCRLCLRLDASLSTLSSLVSSFDHLFFFFSATRPPPRSALFPYTTLFRSLPGSGGRSVLSVCKETGGHERNRPQNRSEEHTSELQSRFDLVCRLLLEKKKN